MAEEEEGVLNAPSPNKDGSKRTVIGTKEWLIICDMWESGDFTLDNIGDRFDRNPSHLSVKLSKEGIIKGSKRDRYKEKLQEGIEKDMSKNIALKVSMAAATNNEGYDWSRWIQMKTMSVLNKAATAVDKEGNPRPLDLCMQDLKTLHMAMKNINDGHIVRRLALGLDKNEVLDEDAMPEIIVTEMSQLDVERIRLEKDEEFRKASLPDAEINEIMAQIAEDPVETEKQNIEKLRREMREEERFNEINRIGGHDIDIGGIG